MKHFGDKYILEFPRVYIPLKYQESLRINWNTHKIVSSHLTMATDDLICDNICAIDDIKTIKNLGNFWLGYIICQVSFQYHQLQNIMILWQITPSAGWFKWNDIIESVHDDILLNHRPGASKNVSFTSIVQYLDIDNWNVQCDYKQDVSHSCKHK